MPPKRDLRDIEAIAHRAIGRPLPQTRAEKLEASGGVAGHAAFVRLLTAVPPGTSAERAALSAYMVGFAQFLQEVFPKELSRSADPKHYARLVGLYLVSQLEVIEVEEQAATGAKGGGPDKRVMTAETLRKQGQYAKEAGHLLMSSATAQDHLRVDKEIDETVLKLAQTYKLDKRERLDDDAADSKRIRRS